VSENRTHVIRCGKERSRQMGTKGEGGSREEEVREREGVTWAREDSVEEKREETTG